MADVSDLSDKLVGYLDLVEKVVEEYHETAIEVAYQYLYTEMVFNIISYFVGGVLLLAIGARFLQVAYWISNWELIQDEDKRKKCQMNYQRDNELWSSTFGALLSMVAGVILIFGFKSFCFSVVGLFAPEVYLVYKVL